MSPPSSQDAGLADRIAGALVGLAAGDALGAPYEFTVPGPRADIRMHAAGPWELGEWTDDTAQAVALAEAASPGHVDLGHAGARMLEWYRGGPKDVGISTRAVLGAATPETLPEVAARYFADNPRGAAGNGSLMRTAPVALAHLGDDAAMADAARRASLLTHGDPLAAEACVLWCVAIDRAVREERLDGVRDGLRLLEPDRAAHWEARLDEAEAGDPHDFSRGNGFVVIALQAAHAAIRATAHPDNTAGHAAGRDEAHAADPDHLRRGLIESVRIGNDTDTVAAIAGQVLGARWGASAVPEEWRRELHGWPGLRTPDLVRLALTAAGASARAAR